MPAAARDLAAVRRLGEVAGEARGAGSYADAAAALDVADFDLVVCALDPDPDAALDLLRDVRARGSRVPFVLLAGAPLPVLRERARLLGPAHWVAIEGLEREALADRFAPEAERGEAARPAAPPATGRNADFAPAMLWRTDPAGSFTHFTLEWCRFRGRGEDDERGRGWESGIHPDDRTRWRETFGKALDTREPFELDLRLCRADGTWRWVRHRGHPRLRGDELIGFLGSSFDITDLVRESRQLREQVERLSRKERELEEFAHAVAHELDQPLRTVEHGLRIVSEDLDAEEDASERDAWLQHARTSARRMRALLRDLLRLALAGEGGRREDVALDEPLEWALQNLAPTLEQSAATIKRQALPAAHCEPTQVAQVFQNLIGNAIKFRRREPLVIEIGGELSGDRVVLRVSDNGRGLDPESRERIFEPFHRLAGDEIPGAGLGLALCKKIVERHGGQIGVRSTPGSGSRFYFSLPAARAGVQAPDPAVAD